jgi:hypothetical protein
LSGVWRNISILIRRFSKWRIILRSRLFTRGESVKLLT